MYKNIALVSFMKFPYVLQLNNCLLVSRVYDGKESIPVGCVPPLVDRRGCPGSVSRREGVCPGGTP